MRLDVLSIVPCFIWDHIWPLPGTEKTTSQLSNILSSSLGIKVMSDQAPRPFHTSAIQMSCPAPALSWQSYVVAYLGIFRSP